MWTGSRNSSRISAWFWARSRRQHDAGSRDDASWRVPARRAWVRPVQLSRQFLAQHPPTRLLERCPAGPDVLLQRGIDQRLVVPATRGMDLGSKPVEHLVVQADRDPRLPRRRGQNRPSLSPAEVVFTCHVPSPSSLYAHVCTAAVLSQRRQAVRHLPGGSRESPYFSVPCFNAATTRGTSASGVRKSSSEYWSLNAFSTSSWIISSAVRPAATWARTTPIIAVSVSR